MGRTLPRQPAGTTGRLFTVESAEATLVLVRRIVTDVVAAYGELMRLRSELQDLSVETGRERELQELRGQIDQRLETLKRLHVELKEIGCELKDFSAGLVDFPALYRGRRVWLCWKLGEDRIAHWHEWESGMAGRQPIDDAFAAELRTAAPCAAQDPQHSVGCEDPEPAG